MKKILSILASLVLVGFTYSAKAEITDKKDSEEAKYEKLFKDKQVKTVKSFMTIHMVDDKVYAEIPLTFMNKELLLVSYVSSISDHLDSHPGINPMVPVLINFEKSGDKVYMNRDKSIVMGDGNDYIQRNIDMSTISARLRSFEIKAWNPDKSAVVIDMTDLMTGSEKLLQPIHARGEGKFMMRGVHYSHQPDGSYLQDVSAHERNMTITSKITYKSNINPLYTRHTTAIMDRSFILLPEEKMPLRETDWRLPIQSSGRLVFPHDFKGTKEFYFAQRWRLDPVDQAAFDRGEGSQVKKPIVFYVDTTFTDNLKYAIVNGVGEWNKAFEKIGFKDVIQFRDFPSPKEDPKFDTENFDYNIIRFSPTLDSGASVRTFTDPRTGEILRTNIEICYNYIMDCSYDILLNMAHADPDARTMFPKDELLREYMKYHLMWLSGVDCFGMTYNLTSSSAFPVDSLRSATFTQTFGTSPSMLDRALFNTLAPIDGAKKGIRTLPTGLGEYDYFVVDWLYRPFKKGDDEKSILKAMVDKTVGNPVYRYEYSKNCPDCAADNVGDDDLLVAKYDLERLEYMLNHFEEWVTDEQDPDYSMRSIIYYNLMRRYKKIMTHIALNIYGVKTWQRMEGDPVPATEFIPKERQLQAINMLFEHLERPEKYFKESCTKNFSLESKPQFEVHVDYMMLLINVATSSLFVYDTAPGDHIRHTDFIDIQVDKIWEPTRKGQELTEAQMYYQDFVFRTLLASSHMVNYKIHKMPVTPKSMQNLQFDYTVEDRCELIEGLQNQLYLTTGEQELLMASGKYGQMKKWPVLYLDSTRYCYYNAMNKAYDWMKTQLQVEGPDDDTKQHYRFLCDMYDRLLDK